MKKKYSLGNILQYVIIGGAILYFGFYFFVKISGVDKGELAPDFEVELIDGSPFKLSDLRGEYVLLDFWGSWCPPCRQANPNLVKFHQNNKDKVTIVSIALEKVANRGRSAAKKDGFTWKNQIVEVHKIVMLSDIARKYGVSEIPAKFLIDPEGRIVSDKSFSEMEKLLKE